MCKKSVLNIFQLLFPLKNHTNVLHYVLFQKLRLFIQDNGKVLSSDQVLADLLDGDQGVFNGGSLIMETVPADLLVLPDSHLYDSGQK